MAMMTEEQPHVHRCPFLKTAGLVLGIVWASAQLAACAPTTVKPAEPAVWLPKSEVTFVVPFAPGGATDPISRLLAQEMEPKLKQKVVVVNKPGAGGAVGTTEIVQAKPDGACREPDLPADLGRRSDRVGRGRDHAARSAPHPSA